jgi:hypothetical protein
MKSRDQSRKIKDMTVTHDPDNGYHAVSFGYGGYDGVHIESFGGGFIRVSETHDGGTTGNEYAEVPLAEFLRGLGVETFVMAGYKPAAEWWE